MGKGQLADLFQPMADTVRADRYSSVVSFDSAYHNGDGNFERGFRQCVERFKQHFGG